MSTLHCSLLSLGCVFGFSSANKATLTALRALKIAQRRLRPEVRAKLLSVSSARTDVTLTPEAWRFVFQDLATSGNSRVVTVAAKTSSEHPDTVEAFSSLSSENVAASHAIAQNKLLVDSDQALQEAREVVNLEEAHTAEYRLTQHKSNQEPLWILHFYAETGEAMACVQVGAKTGTVQIIEDGQEQELVHK